VGSDYSEADQDVPLFVPLISRHTHERKEGYFRLEWKLAVDRSNLISPTQAFLLPVVIDDTREDDEEVPDKLREVHWTRLPSGETSAGFVDRVRPNPHCAMNVDIQRIEHGCPAGSMVLARQYSDAVAAYQAALSLEPDDPRLHALLGETRYLMGDLQAARASCEFASADLIGQICLAVTYQRLGMHSKAEAVLNTLESSLGDLDAYNYATIYAQWGDVPKTLDWLERALRLRDSGLVELKTEPYLDPVRYEPRFQAIERALKFPAN
jgi:tetratricopeptide (TPR) repeat protein